MQLLVNRSLSKPINLTMKKSWTAMLGSIKFNFRILINCSNGRSSLGGRVQKITSIITKKCKSQTNHIFTKEGSQRKKTNITDMKKQKKPFQKVNYSNSKKLINQCEVALRKVGQNQKDGHLLGKNHGKSQETV